jgi:hypothetical protein
VNRSGIWKAVRQRIRALEPGVARRELRVRAKALGGTPAERKALGVEIESVDALAELRARRRAI